MAVYAIGDIQGCYDEFMRLLERLAFDPAHDKLWLAGDLVNRGPHSLEVLRFVKGLGRRAVTVLGNHDLHLLALSAGNTRHQSRDHTLDAILAAPDRDELLHWLRHRPLMHRSRKRGYALVHAGLPPQWDTTEALARAAEVESTLQGDGFRDFCMRMYGNKPDRWDSRLDGMDRLRFITNCFTRMRYCDARGRLALGEKGAPGTQAPGLMPWFQVAGRASRESRIVFGHWSTLGFYQGDNVVALDSGCLWGGWLTAFRLKKGRPADPIQVGCAGRRKPHGRAAT